MQARDLDITRKAASTLLSMTALLFFSSCGVFKSAVKSEFTSEFYQMKEAGIKSDVYVEIMGEDLSVYATERSGKVLVVDTTEVLDTYPAKKASVKESKVSFRKKSLDLDFFTIPLKYRFGEPELPHQLSTSLNGTVYLGYRTDVFSVTYRPDPLKHSHRKIKHIGFSYGLFSGLGNTFMSPTTTNFQIQEEYDGVVWNAGIAGIIGIDNLSVGLTLGIDKLLDENKEFWIYQDRPWLGIALGLNLN